MQDCWLGASPDGLVYDPSMDDPHGVVEIKCPASARDVPLKEACSNSNFFLQITDDNKYQLKTQHNYYYQVQGQMHITKRA